MSEEKNRKVFRIRRSIALAFACLVLGMAVYIAADRDQKPSAINLAIVTGNQTPFWDPVIRGATDAAKDCNVTLTVVRSEPEEPAQSRYMKELLSKSLQGIAVSPNDPSKQAELLNEIAQKMALVTYDSDAPHTNRRMFVGTDNYAAGQLCAEEVRAALPEGGGVIISVGSLDKTVANDRRQGLIDALLDRSFDRKRAADPLDAELKGAQYSVVATVLDGGDRAAAPALIAEAMKAHPEAKCVVGLYSYSAPAAMKAVAQSGSSGKVKIVGFDEDEITQSGVQSGEVYSSILQDQYRMGYEAIRQLADLARGVGEHGPVGPRITYLTINVMNKDNLAELLSWGRIRQPKAKPAS